VHRELATGISYASSKLKHELTKVSEVARTWNNARLPLLQFQQGIGYLFSKESTCHGLTETWHSSSHHKPNMNSRPEGSVGLSLASPPS
jgi:hypothetical protein